MASRDDAYQRREPASDYSDDFTLEKEHIEGHNGLLWDIYHDIPNLCPIGHIGQAPPLDRNH